jgi:putative aldouronate transport system permease protein
MNCAVVPRDTARAVDALPGRSLALERLRRRMSLLVLVCPGIILVFIFNYIPIAGLQLAFREFTFSGGIWRSPWVGLANFRFLQTADFWHTTANTLRITLVRLLVGFSAPVVLALLLNEVRHLPWKRLVQTATYIPYFVSWIVVVGFMDSFLSVQGGVVNDLLGKLFRIPPVFFMGEPRWFLPLVVGSYVWKNTGFDAIYYLAALSGVNPELYEAAEIDGAGRWRQMLSVTLPGIFPTITILFVLRVPFVVYADVNQIFPLQNPANLELAEVLDTYIVRRGIQAGQYSLATAVGLFLSLVGLVLLLASNRLSRRLGGAGIW